MADYPHQTKGARSQARFKADPAKRLNHNAGVRSDLRSVRQAEAKARKAEYDNLTVQQKLDRLDKRLGKGLGATRERARLAASLPVEKVIIAVTDFINAKVKPKGGVIGAIAATIGSTKKGRK